MAAAGMKLNAVDDHTFTMDFSSAFTSAIDIMAKPSWPLFVFPERDTLQPPTQPVTDAIGSGPFRFVKSEWQPGSKLVFEKNPDYVPRAEPADGYTGGKVVKVDRVEWNIIADGNTAMAALQNGEVDAVEHISNDMVPALKADPDITLKIFNKVGVQAFLTMNQKQPPFDNVKARQALLYLVNQEDYMRSVAGDKDFWQVCWAYLMCNSPAGSEAGAEVHKAPDLDKAKALLKEAGYNGEKIVLYAATGIPAMPEEAQVLAQELQQIGVNVDVQQMDYNTLLSKRRNSGPIDQGGWNLLPIWAFGPNQMNPLTNSSLSATCDEKTAYPGWACSPALEQLRTKWAGAPQDQRKELGEQIQKTGLDTVVTVPLGQFYQPVAYRNALSGILQTPYFAMWNVEKKQ
jgi:peptide/nickel transport system substrate-binding protein